MTIRGTLLFLLSIYFLFWPWGKEADLVAGTIATSLLALIVISAVGTVVGAMLLRRRLSLKVTPPNDELVAGRRQLFVINCPGFFIPPLFALEARLLFDQDGVITALHRSVGPSGAREVRQYHEQLTFPHRGKWRLRGVQLRWGDALGLTAYRWMASKPSNELAFTVHPQPGPIKPIPVLSSSWIEGEDVITTDNRSGDYYDIKSYHPADGMRKILWKLYAKSGQLFARHPEPSMTPEGKVVVFCMAGPSDDQVCFNTGLHLKELEELNLELAFGCEGFSQSFGDEVSGKVARSCAEGRELMIASVWQTIKTDRVSITRDLEQLLGSPGLENVKKVLIISSRARLQTEAGCELHRAVAQTLTERGLEPAFCFIGADTAAASRQNPSRVRRAVERLLITDAEHQPATNPALAGQFLRHCAEARWEVVG